MKHMPVRLASERFALITSAAISGSTIATTLVVTTRGAGGVVAGLAVLFRRLDIPALIVASRLAPTLRIGMFGENLNDDEQNDHEKQEGHKLQIVHGHLQAKSNVPSYLH